MILDRRQFRAIAALSLPAVIINITTPLLALTDIAIVGHLGSAVFIAAIAVGGTMFNILYWPFGFLRMGTSGLTAQAFGAGRRREAYRVLNRALLLAVTIGGVMILLSGLLSSALMLLIDADEPTAEVAAAYFRICIWGAPASLGTFALTGWCVGMQDSRLPMWVSLFVDLFNIALSLTLVYVFGFGMKGVAIGTLSAQWAGFALGLLLVAKRFGWYRIGIKELTTDLGRFFKVNSDIFLRTLCLASVTLWFTRCGAEQGATMLAVNALLMQLFTLFSYFMDGLAFAGEALCGRYAGASDHLMLSKSIRAIMTLGGVLALLFTIVYVVGGSGLLGWLSSDRDVIEASREYTIWAICVPLVSFAAFMWDGIFIGLTRTRMMLVSMASATACYFLVLWILESRLGNHGLWIAFLSYLLVRGLVLTIAGRRYLSIPSSPYSAR